MKFTAATLLTLALSVQAMAGTIICGGKVDQLAYHAPNRLMIKLDSMNTPVFFCNTEEEWSVPGTTTTTGPGACKTLYSTFLAAQLSGKVISNMYFDGDAAPGSCNTWGNFQNANIRYYIINQ